MANPSTPTVPIPETSAPEVEDAPVCVMTFNASDPSGAGGLTADIMAISSAGGHALGIVTGAYVRDTAEIFDHVSFDEEAVSEQARTALEDMPVSAIKVGFVGNPENISTVAEIAADYAEVPLIAYMPSLAWWSEDKIDDYLDAFRELLLPQTTILVGNHSTLWRWLLPDWPGDRNPSAKDIAKAAAQLGVPYTLVTGIPLPEQFIDNVLATPQAVLYSEKFERFEAVFAGAGDTLSAALTALLANGHDLVAATAEALTYLDQSLSAGFHPGMGQTVPDRMFWAQTDGNPDDEALDDAPATDDADLTMSVQRTFFDMPPHGTTKH
ncbi:MAG: bifunctional hydroxymethylpyrimidine kinase/phosphomethylpyrimidine kinase [Polaromonas sp.]